jgi:hypothetical protein
MPPRVSRWLPALIVVGLAVGLVSFWWFLIDTVRLGGDALNGHVIDGHYFVNSHGRFTEVPPGDWIANRNLGVLALAAFPFALLAGGVLLFRYVFPYFMSGRAPYAADQSRVERIRASSELLATSSSGGVVGEVWSSAGLLAADIYEAGIILRPTFMPSAGIPVDEIRSIRNHDRRLVIDHEGLEVASPIVLFVDEESTVSRAIKRVVGQEARDVSRHAEAALTPISLSRTSRPPAYMRKISFAGLVLGFVLVLLGVFWAIPAFGGIGVGWTVGAIVITSFSAIRFLRRGF